MAWRSLTIHVSWQVEFRIAVWPYVATNHVRPQDEKDDKL